MKSLIRIAVPLLSAGLCLPSVCALAAPQPVSQDQQTDGGMGGFQMAEHSVHGNITAISGNTLTVKTDDGETYTVATGPNTRFRKLPDPIKITDLHIGDEIAAIGDKDSKTKTVGAMFVVVIDKQQEQKMRADFGKTWTAGVVQSIDGTNIVIKRADNVTQTIAVDENTEFRRRREDITLVDIKPGDSIGARGALQNGAFLATTVTDSGTGHFGEGGAGAWYGQRSGSASAGAAPPNN
jgi:Domain of unknown function (DUF5666)